MTKNSYIVRSYNGPSERVFEVTGISAEQVLRAAIRHEFPGADPSVSSRYQMSPLEADRDNRHAQFDAAGRKGIAVRRKETDLAAAEHRNDVEVAKKWVSEGRKLADLQRYGGYQSVSERDL